MARASCTRPARVADDVVLDGHFYVGPGCEVAAGARLGPSATLVAEVRVEPGAHIRESVLWRGVSVGRDSEVERSLLGLGAAIGRSTVLHDAVLGEGSIVSDFSRAL